MNCRCIFQAFSHMWTYHGIIDCISHTVVLLKISSSGQKFREKLMEYIDEHLIINPSPPPK